MVQIVHLNYANIAYIKGCLHIINYLANLLNSLTCFNFLGNSDAPRGITGFEILAGQIYCGQVL